MLKGKMRSRLALVSTEAVENLASLPEGDLRRLAREIAIFALETVGLTIDIKLSPTSEIELIHLQHQLEARVEELDGVYFDAANAANGDTSQPIVAAAFSRARAMNAAFFALRSA